MDIQDKVAIVTGAARGIGRASAVALAQAGARAVAIVDLDGETARETADLVRAAGAEAQVVETDVGQVESLRDMIYGTEERFGALHILHNNAGMGEGTTDWPAVPLKRASAIIDVNLRAVILGTHLALDPISRAGGGAIIHTASGAAFTPLPPQAVYAATKAGIVHFTRSCTPLVESHGVRVSCVCPGLVRTAMLADTGGQTTPAWLAGVLEAVELLEPAAIAGKVVALASDPESAGKVVSVENRPRKPTPRSTS